MAIDDDDPLLRPEDAHVYLGRRGISRTKSTLSKLRCIGGGPEFVKIGTRQVGYYKSSLDAYVDRMVSGPLASTSETPRRPKAPTRIDETRA
jgi:hypothetical protein